MDASFQLHLRFLHQRHQLRVHLDNLEEEHLAELRECLNLLTEVDPYDLQVTRCRWKVDILLHQLGVTLRFMIDVGLLVEDPEMAWPWRATRVLDRLIRRRRREVAEEAAERLRGLEE